MDGRFPGFATVGSQLVSPGRRLGAAAAALAYLFTALVDDALVPLVSAPLAAGYTYSLSSTDTSLRLTLTGCVRACACVRARAGSCVCVRERACRCVIAVLPLRRCRYTEHLPHFATLMWRCISGLVVHNERLSIVRNSAMRGLSSFSAAVPYEQAEVYKRVVQRAMLYGPWQVSTRACHARIIHYANNTNNE
jgi:hypothetical protein